MNVLCKISRLEMSRNTIGIYERILDHSCFQPRLGNVVDNGHVVEDRYSNFSDKFDNPKDHFDGYEGAL